MGEPAISVRPLVVGIKERLSQEVRWSHPRFQHSEGCLALTYEKLGPHAEAEATLAKFQAENGDASAYQYATIYAQRGNTPEALEWLDTAMRVRAPGVVYLKTDPLLDPLRNEPHFQAIERELKFPY